MALSYIQNVSEAVARIIEAKEESWNYVPPKLDVEIHSVAIGLDGTCCCVKQDGERRWWELSASITQQANGNIQFILVQHPNKAKRQFKDEMQRGLMKQRILRKEYDSQVIFSVCD
ncbi:hypothetical protein B9G53_18905 [Pseudanabaena sp. SR411]|uniref:hypothetical protein n=1 Tax=Pseudanabaena sp. SR411 TaxID=1980935 RepID=UPI000B98E505|nr:hypothetical protein [Pseudanabaena sp. SR411]OYQ63097.1 hypothetical protein B9G53_18905 [Pseudanabaena sp. SR411]